MGAKLHGLALRVAGIKTRLALVLLACVVALSTLVSALAIAELHTHECEGDECPVCLVLEISHAVLSLAAGGPDGSAFAAVLHFSAAIAVVMCCFILCAETPVSSKVQLVI